MIAKALGDAARELRVELEISQEALAGLAGIERSHMGKIERGEHMPALTAVWKLSCALGITASQLLAVAERKLPNEYDPRVL